MNHYPHHIGDYDSDTAHLDWLEDMAYTRLLRLYYRTEHPIPKAINDVCRLVRAKSSPERKSVEVVLREFFELTEDGWINKRAEEEITKYQAKASANRINGKAGGRPKETKLEPIGLSVGSDSITQNNLNQNQNQEPSKPAAAKAADPEKEEIWKTGKTLLNGDTKDAGSFLGKLCKEYGQILVLQAIRDCVVATPVEPKAWLTARCQERRANSGNKSSAIETRNHAAVEQALKEASYGRA